MLVCRKIGRCHNCYTEIVKFQISNKTDVNLIKYCRQCKRGACPSNSPLRPTASAKLPRQEPLGIAGKTPMLNPSLQVLQSEFP